MIILEINGTKYQGFKSARVRKSIEEISGSLQFVATSDKIDDFPIERFAECKVLIDDESILNGFIDIREFSYDSSNHEINIQGRDKTSILVDSSVWDKRTFKKTIGIITIAEKIISDLESDIEVINNVGTSIDDFKRDINAEVGESAFDFLERLARKRQILLTTNGDGNLVLTRGSTNRIATILLMKKNSHENNILKARISFDDSQRYSEYKVLGQTVGNPLISNKNQTVQKGYAEDTDALTEKKLIVQAEQEIDIKTATDRAKWESNIRRAKSVTYNCTVQGHVHSNGLWEINTLVKVVDDYSQIDSEMLIKSVEFILDNNGSFTNLELVARDAYTLENEQPVFEKKKNNLGYNFSEDDYKEFI